LTRRSGSARDSLGFGIGLNGPASGSLRAGSPTAAGAGTSFGVEGVATTAALESGSCGPSAARARAGSAARFGAANHFRTVRTLTLSSAIVIRAWSEIAESVHRAGVRKLVLVTSHGGNLQAIELIARELRVRLNMFLVVCAWHRFGYPDNLFSAAERHHGIHAGAIETSIMLAARPETVRQERARNAVPASVAMERDFRWLHAYRPAGFGWATQDLHPSGAVGDPTAASREAGEAALDYGAKAFVELLGEVDRFDLSRLAKGPLDQ